MPSDWSASTAALAGAGAGRPDVDAAGTAVERLVRGRAP
jgi:hypothetical protein